MRKHKNDGEADALKAAVVESIEQGILKEYLLRKGSEVHNMLIAEYDYEMDIQELGFPTHVRMLVNAATRQATIEPCRENSKNAVPFSKDEKKQNYAVVLKIPALMTAIRKLADVEEETTSICFRGTLYPNEKVIIYDISQGEPVKKRTKRKKAEEAAEAAAE